MKKFTILVIVLVIISCEKKSAKEFSVDHSNTMVEIKNHKIQELLNDYFRENLSEVGKGVIIVDLKNNSDTSTFIVYSSLSID
jgi:predicted HAD superfamily phosphohydrolase YqeG